MKEENIAENNDGFDDINTNSDEVKTYSYSEEVKDTIIGSLEKGTSVLQKDREGIRYPQNDFSKTIYNGVNNFLLSQRLEDGGYESPMLYTLEQMKQRAFWVKPGEKAIATINYYCPEGLRYHFDEYPMIDGRPDKTQVPIHKKGDFKLDEEGKKIIGYDYNNVYNVAQIDPNLKQFKRFAKPDEQGRKGVWETVPDSFEIRLKTDIRQEAPFNTAVPGIVYKAQDNSILEVFAEQYSKYVNSCVTGCKYKAWKPTSKQIEELKSLSSENNSQLFKKINDAYFLGVGNTEKYNFVNTRREEKAREVKEGKEPPKKSRAM